MNVEHYYACVWISKGWDVSFSDSSMTSIILLSACPGLSSTLSKKSFSTRKCIAWDRLETVIRISGRRSWRKSMIRNAKIMIVGMKVGAHIP